MEASFKQKHWEYWEHYVTFRPSQFAGKGNLIKSLRNHAPVILHFACHGQKSALQLFEGDLDVQTFVKAIKAWCNDGDKKLRIIVVNACHGSHLVQALAQYVDFVIGHDTPVQDQHALRREPVRWAGKWILIAHELQDGKKKIESVLHDGPEKCWKFQIPVRQARTR